MVWAGGLAVFSLFFVRPDADDTQYVHQSTWIAEHGSFPLRDTLFSDQILPAIIYPPLVLRGADRCAGRCARGPGRGRHVPARDSAGDRAWRPGGLAAAPRLGVRMVGLALSTAMVFLLMAAEEHRTLGNLFVGRIWQGKIVLLVVLVPVLFVLLQEYSERPTRRSLVLLAAGGAAGVGLTSSGTFLVLALGAGCLAPLVFRSVKEAAIGFAAVAAYPLGALVVTAAVGARRAGGPSRTWSRARSRGSSSGAAFWHSSPSRRHWSVPCSSRAAGPPSWPRRRCSSRSLRAAGAAAHLGRDGDRPRPLAGRLDRTGGRPRGSRVTALPARVGPPALRALPAVLACAALIVWGSPIWDAGTVRAEPS